MTDFGPVSIWQIEDPCNHVIDLVRQNEAGQYPEFNAEVRALILEIKSAQQGSK